MSSIKKNLLALVFFSGLVQLAFAQDDTFLDDEIVAFAASNYLPSGKFNTPSWRNRPNPHLRASLADIYLNNDKLHVIAFTYSPAFSGIPESFLSQSPSN